MPNVDDDASPTLETIAAELLGRLDPSLRPTPKQHRLWPGRFAGRNVLITGAGSGIGLATAVRFAEEGATVIGLDRSSDGLDRMKDLSPSLGERGQFLIADVTDLSDVQRAVKAATEHGVLDVLVNCAGITEQVPWDKMTPERWDRMFAVNLRGLFFLTQAVAEHMRANGYGRIVNLASGAAKSARPNGLHYAASKAGVVSLTRSLAKSLAGHGVCVNAICPGGVITEMAVKDDGWGLPGGRAAQRLRDDPTARPMLPEEVASLIAFLSSEEAEYITGQAINIDAGENMMS